MHAISLDWTIENTSTNKTAVLTSPATVGRATDNTIVIVQGTISRHHARINSGDGGVRIQNLSSSAVVNINNTNSIAQNQTGPLKDGDFVMLGTVRVGVRIVQFPDGTNLDANCINCARPISSQVDICPWCGTSQSNPEGHITGMT